FSHHIRGGEGASTSPCQVRRREKTLSATRGMEDCPRMKATVVTDRWANLARNECSGGLAAETAVKALEEARGRGYVRQGLLTLLLHSHSPQAQALAQGLEGDLLALDLDRQGENAVRWSETRGCCGDQVAGVILLNRSGCPIWARLLLAAVEGSLRAVYDVDVDEILRVKGMNLASTGSHGEWGEDGESKVGVHTTRPIGSEKGQEVETEVPRAAEAGLYTGEVKGRLCALVCAQLVRAQHADAAPGAVDNDVSISGK
ncbi:hypothetical protein POSPLADRAFT_1152997, partial [Postia placenta MAD-698-R-SB12]